MFAKSKEGKKGEGEDVAKEIEDQKKRQEEEEAAEHGMLAAHQLRGCRVEEGPSGIFKSVGLVQKCAREHTCLIVCEFVFGFIVLVCTMVLDILTHLKVLIHTCVCNYFGRVAQRFFLVAMCKAHW
mmetsp:Transcript_119509/g.382978  ORF Transcript_119509/g.382978 Transcript_119509/m.382978 type:complete len:126 (-) Transcript_119509:15-392(-)